MNGLRCFLLIAILSMFLAPARSLARDRPNPRGRLVRDVTGGELYVFPPRAPRSEPLAPAAPAPLPAGAVLLDSTYYDLQDMGSLGNRIVRSPAGEIYLTYMRDYCELDPGGCPPDLAAPQPFPERAMGFAYRDALSAWSRLGKVEDPSVRGCCLSELFGGFGAMGMTPDGRAAIAQHMNEDGCDERGALYIQDAAGMGSYTAYLSPITDPSYLFPQVAVTPGGAYVLMAEIALFGSYDETDEFRISYLGSEGVSFTCPVGWQFGPWTSVVSSSLFRDGNPAYPAIAAGADGRVGIAVGDFGGNVYLVESSDGTFNPATVTTTNITGYSDASITSPGEGSTEYRPFIHCDLAYDGTTPNVVWSELQARNAGGIFYVDFRSRIMHWDPVHGISTVYQVGPGEADTYDNVDNGGSGPLAGFNTISVDWPQVGFSANGQETYVAWLRFVDGEVDPTADMGLPGIVTGIGYGDVACSLSLAGGPWTPPQNLTSTPSTDERFFSLADRNSNGRVHLVFQASATDEAGVTVIGDRGFSNRLFVRRIAYLERDLNDSSTGVEEGADLGRSGAELTAYPNPASGRVRFELARAPGPAEEAILEIYSVSGRRVARLVLEEANPFAVWDGRDESGRPVGSGVYFARVRRNGAWITEKIQLVR